MSRRFFAIGAASTIVASGLLGAALAAAPHAVPGPIRTEPQPIAAAVASQYIPDCHFPGLPLLCAYTSDNGD